MHAPAQHKRPALHAGILFFEDFDADPLQQVAAAAEPVPAFTETDLARARAAGFAAGRLDGAAQARGEHEAGAHGALTMIAASLGDAAQCASAASEEQASVVARLLLRALGAVLPALCARFGAAEAAAVALVLQPALHHEPAVSVRVNPHTRACLADALRALDPDLRARLRFIETDAVAEGDARIEWHEGAAVRDGAALWRSVTEVLAPLGLLDASEHAREVGGELAGAAAHGR